jgi:hypothetical protein
MAIRFLLDENIPGQLWTAIGLHNLSPRLPIDAVRVGDPPDLPRGTKDPDLLLWAAREDRVLLTLDKSTMPSHLSAHLAAGERSPGVLILDIYAPIQDLVDHLELVAHAGDPDDYRDMIQYAP